MATRKSFVDLRPYMGLVNALAHRQNFELAEDLAQIGLMALTKALRKNPAPDNPFAFAKVVVKRALITAEHKRLQGRQPLDSASSEYLDVVQPVTQPDYGDSAEAFFSALERRCGRDVRQMAERVERTKVGRRDFGFTQQQWGKILEEIRRFMRVWNQVHDPARAPGAGICKACPGPRQCSLLFQAGKPLHCEWPDRYHQKCKT